MVIVDRITGLLSHDARSASLFHHSEGTGNEPVLRSLLAALTYHRVYLASPGLLVLPDVISALPEYKKRLFSLFTNGPLGERWEQVGNFAAECKTKVVDASARISRCAGRLPRRLQFAQGAGLHNPFVTQNFAQVDNMQSIYNSFVSRLCPSVPQQTPEAVDSLRRATVAIVDFNNAYRLDVEDIGRVFSEIRAGKHIPPSLTEVDRQEFLCHQVDFLDRVCEGTLNASQWSAVFEEYGIHKFSVFNKNESLGAVPVPKTARLISTPDLRARAIFSFVGIFGDLTIREAPAIVGSRFATIKGMTGEQRKAFVEEFASGSAWFCNADVSSMESTVRTCERRAECDSVVAKVGNHSGLVSFIEGVYDEMSRCGREFRLGGLCLKTLLPVRGSGEGMTSTGNYFVSLMRAVSLVHHLGLAPSHEAALAYVLYNAFIEGDDITLRLPHEVRNSEIEKWYGAMGANVTGCVSRSAEFLRTDTVPNCPSTLQNATDQILRFYSLCSTQAADSTRVARKLYAAKAVSLLQNSDRRLREFGAVAFTAFQDAFEDMTKDLLNPGSAVGRWYKTYLAAGKDRLVLADIPALARSVMSSPFTEFPSLKCWTPEEALAKLNTFCCWEDMKKVCYEEHFPDVRKLVMDNATANLCFSYLLVGLAMGGQFFRRIYHGSVDWVTGRLTAILGGLSLASVTALAAFLLGPGMVVAVAIMGVTLMAVLGFITAWAWSGSIKGAVRVTSVVVGLGVTLAVGVLVAYYHGKYAGVTNFVDWLLGFIPRQPPSRVLETVPLEVGVSAPRSSSLLCRRRDLRGSGEESDSDDEAPRLDLSDFFSETDSEVEMSTRLVLGESHPVSPPDVH